MRQISPTGNQTGFTLLEILLSLFIIGLMLGLVSLTLPDSDTKILRQSALTLKRSLLLAQEKAVFKSRDYGLLIASTGYQFFSYQEDEWVLENPPSQLKPKQFYKQLNVQLSIENQAITLEQATEPQILILSDGQLSEFSIEFNQLEDSETWRLSGSFDGAIELSTESNP